MKHACIAIALALAVAPALSEDPRANTLLQHQKHGLEHAEDHEARGEVSLSLGDLKRREKELKAEAGQLRNAFEMHHPKRATDSLVQAEPHAEPAVARLMHREALLQKFYKQEEVNFESRQVHHSVASAAFLQKGTPANETSIHQLEKRAKGLDSIFKREEAAFFQRNKGFYPKASAALMQTGTRANETSIHQLEKRAKGLDSIFKREEAAFVQRNKGFYPKASAALVQTGTLANETSIHQLENREKRLDGIFKHEEAAFVQRNEGLYPKSTPIALLQQEMHHADHASTQEQLTRRLRRLQASEKLEEATFTQRQEGNFQSRQPHHSVNSVALMQKGAPANETSIHQLEKREKRLDGIAKREEAAFVQRNRGFYPKASAALVQKGTHASETSTDQLDKREKRLEGIFKREEAAFMQRNRGLYPKSTSNALLQQEARHVDQAATQEQLTRRLRRLQTSEKLEEAAFTQRQNAQVTSLFQQTKQHADQAATQEQLTQRRSRMQASEKIKEVVHSKFVCGQQTTIALSTSADAAGAAEFSDFLTTDGKCNQPANDKVTAVKFCGPGKLLLSRMTCSEHHEYKAMVVEHSSAEYTTNCETVSASGTVVDGWLGSFTLTC